MKRRSHCWLTAGVSAVIRASSDSSSSIGTPCSIVVKFDSKSQESVGCPNALWVHCVGYRGRPLSLTLCVIYGQFWEITDASWHIEATGLINLGDLWLCSAWEREDHQCEIDILGRADRERHTLGGESLSSLFGVASWQTQESGFPSVLFSPWPLSASLVHLSRLNSCYGTSPLRPCHRPQRARTYHPSHRWATHTTGTSLQMAKDVNPSDMDFHAGDSRMTNFR